MTRLFGGHIGALVILALNISWAQTANFTDNLADCLAERPLTVDYTYVVSGAGLEQATEGKLVLAGDKVFRVNLWDKVYSSDGVSLYLHDTNTKQTLIDSLHWGDLNIWIRILQGELPAETTITQVDSSSTGIEYQLSNSQPWWEADVSVEPGGGCIRSLAITDLNGYHHQIELERPQKMQITDADSLFTLLDLSGTRLDLR